MTSCKPRIVNLRSQDRNYSGVDRTLCSHLHIKDQGYSKGGKENERNFSQTVRIWKIKQNSPHAGIRWKEAWEPFRDRSFSRVVFRRASDSRLKKMAINWSNKVLGNPCKIVQMRGAGKW